MPEFDSYKSSAYNSLPALETFRNPVPFSKKLSGPLIVTFPPVISNPPPEARVRRGREVSVRRRTGDGRWRDLQRPVCRRGRGDLHDLADEFLHDLKDGALEVEDEEETEE